MTKPHPLKPFKQSQGTIDCAVQSRFVSEQTVPLRRRIQFKRAFFVSDVCLTVSNDQPTLAPEEGGELLDKNLLKRSFRQKIAAQPIQQVFKIGPGFTLKDNGTGKNPAL